MVVPFGDGGLHLESYFWERDADFWTADNYGRKGRTSVQPTCLYVVDGDNPDDRRLLFGAEDGFVRYHDSDAVNDDGEVIDSFALIDLAPGNAGIDVMATDFEIVTASDQAGPNVYLYAANTAQRPQHPKWHGRIRQGRALVKERIRGASCWLGIGLADVNGRFGVESMAVDLRAMGRTRVPA